MRINLIQAGAIALLGSAAVVSAATIYPVNDGFESPDLGAGGYGYAQEPYGFTTLPLLPSAPPGWSFTGTTGLTANGSPFGTIGAANGNVNGGATSTSGQAAFIQNGYGDPNTISQIVAGFGLGTASVTFSLESRGGNNAGVDVKLDGVDLGTYTPVGSGSFNTVTTPSIPVTAGSHTLLFTGVSAGGDNTAFIDSVSINNVVPEPASLSLLGLGGLGLLARRRGT